MKEEELKDSDTTQVTESGIIVVEDRIVSIKNPSFSFSLFSRCLSKRFRRCKSVPERKR